MSRTGTIRAVIAAIAAVVLLAPQAGAYGTQVCVDLFAQANVAKAEKFRVLASSADFGDDPHLFGDPQGTAIVCWSTDGRVGIKGRLFSDGGIGGDAETAARITFFRANGPSTTLNVSSSGTGVNSRLVYTATPAGSWNRVRIRLYSVEIQLLHPTDGSRPPPKYTWLRTRNLRR